MHTKLKNTIKYIIFLKDKSIFVGRKLTTINVGNDKLEGILEKFLNSQRLEEKVSEVYNKKGFCDFVIKDYFEDGKRVIFHDLFTFCLHFKVNGIYFKDKQVGFYYENKIYMVRKKDVDFFLYYSSQALPSIELDTVKEIKGDYKIFINSKLLERREDKIKKLLLKSKNKIEDPAKDWTEVQIKDYTIRLENNLPGEFLDKNILQISGKKVKIKTGLLDPVLSVFPYKKEKDKFGYGAKFVPTNKNEFKKLENIFSSTGFSYDDRELSKIKAFAEAMERFNSGCFKSDLVHKKKLKDYDFDLIQTILGFEIDKKFYDKQYYAKKIYEITPLPTREGLGVGNQKRLGIGSGFEIPIDLVCYPPISKKQDQFFKANSNGIGAGVTYEKAFLSGLMELSERDSVMLTWIHKLTPDIIDNDSLPKEIRQKVTNLENKSSGNLFIFDVSYGKKFSHVLTILKDEYNKITVGSSAGFDLFNTINKSLDEVSVSFFYSKRETKIINKYSEIIGVSDHTDFFNNKGNIKYLDFLFTKNNIVMYDELLEQFGGDYSLGEQFEILEKSVGGKFYISDLTTTYSKSLGLYVLKVISENLIPIWFGFSQKNNLPQNKPRFSTKNQFKKWQLNANNHPLPNFIHFFD